MRFEFYMRLTYMQYDAVKPFKKLKMFCFSLVMKFGMIRICVFWYFFKNNFSLNEYVYAYTIFASSYCLSMILY